MALIGGGGGGDEMPILDGMRWDGLGRWKSQLSMYRDAVMGGGGMAECTVAKFFVDDQTVVIFFFWYWTAGFATKVVEPGGGSGSLLRHGRTGGPRRHPRICCAGQRQFWCITALFPG